MARMRGPSAFYYRTKAAQNDVTAEAPRRPEVNFPFPPVALTRNRWVNLKNTGIPPRVNLPRRGPLEIALQPRLSLSFLAPLHLRG